jgi:membrane protein DedA with SNARE-associated domain
LLIFRFIKDSLSENIKSLISTTRRQRIMSIFELKIFRWLVPFVGALIVASPLPDEIGLAMMGFAKMETKFFIPISFFLNFIGILILSLLAKY